MLEKRVCVLTSGCPENRIDAARVRNFFKKSGWIIIDDHKAADLVVFNTCGFTTDRIKKSMNVINKLQKEKKAGSKLIVGGCLPRIDPESLKQVYVGPIFRDKELENLIDFAGSDVNFDSITANQLISEYELKKAKTLASLFAFPLVEYYKFLESRMRISNGFPPKYYIKIASGCAGNCSYCGIRKSRGSTTSVPVEKIISQLREGLKEGFKIFNLLGTDLGPYGIDLGYTLVDLLEEMISEKGDFKIGLRNINPFFLKKMLRRMSPILNSGRIWYLGSAVESGSNRILKLMNRKYTVEDFKECIHFIHRLSPRTILRTQMMVGFPTENEQDFNQSMDLLDEVVFDFVEVYEFSKVPGTPAANMLDQVPEKTRTRRFRKLVLKYLFQRISRKINMIWGAGVPH